MRVFEQKRTGKILVLTLFLLPILCGVVALVLDGGAMIAQRRQVQHLADAAATAAARSLYEGHEPTAVIAVALQTVHEDNESPGADVAVNIPPTEGAFAGNNDYVEVVVSESAPTLFAQLTGHEPFYTVRAAAVAGHKPATEGAAVMILDPDPPPLPIPIVSSLLPPIPSRLGGLEVIGVGELSVDGALVCNNEWGGVDENGNPAGAASGPPYGMSATPVLPLVRIRARDIRVVGGVDNPDNYGHADSGKPSPLRANKMPCPDPWSSLLTPTTSADPTNIYSTEHGSLDVSLPLNPLDLLTPVIVTPGVYEWIQIAAGNVTFQPGVYIIRNVHPITGISLNLIGGQITANGVMFYVTNSPAYTPTLGAPDRDDGETSPPQVTSLTPSVLINLALGSLTFTPLNSPSSPFDRFGIYQRRHDRRPIVLVQQSILGSNSFQGDIYAKWGEIVLVGQGAYQSRMVVGAMRVVNALQCRITPDTLLPPARDVFLVE